ncbi:uncharacterized protein LOC126843767 [Adelges cooleyi]|uniref:uncharacterized protein LOC126843767 n=1 Tax=Adelges cooleyi TaxID=133065 RepID=UPI00217F323A|nr:uncharacterized protein LOC126843767 [Adelges cooleyi]XP_050437472.1 uncharacterized protein LOC126843767 [Adelges cooleyi]XP_050437473.1 uncharacterized protein LOC126843767 [Adelges cooleyi]XP_050437474.1 uncharacterized protein LOC126843767 [Adelges cooleyi]
MKSTGLRLLPVLLVSSLNVVSGHQCYNLPPVPNFDPAQFLGTWYALHSTEPQHRCVVYDLYTLKLKNTRIRENRDCPGCMHCEGCVDCKDCVASKNCKRSTKCLECIDCISCTGCLRCTDCIGLINGVDVTGYRPPGYDREAKYSFTGKVEADPSLPSQSTVSVTSPMPNVDGEMNWVVFATDYVTHAGIYACQKTSEGYNHSITVLSRSEVLEETVLHDLSTFVVEHMVHSTADDLQFVKIDHENCDHPYEKFDVNRNIQNVIDRNEKVYISINFMADKDTTPFGCVKIS